MLNAADDISRITLAPEQVAVLPSLGERDIFRAFQLLPGVSGSQETSSGLYQAAEKLREMGSTD